jgi:hypothetical protein
VSSDIFANLEAIRHFLTEDLAAQVPAQLRAEVRAAGKLLREIAREIDALPALLLAECAAMLELCERAMADAPQSGLRLELAQIRQQIEAPMATLSGQLRLHETLQGNIGMILIALIEAFDNSPPGSGESTAIGTRIEAIYRLLADQADARMDWQSVFPPLSAAKDTEV